MVSFLDPFGGSEKSGVGREDDRAAIDAYLRTKSAWINLAQDLPDPFVMR